MAFIKYLSPELIPESDRVSDDDNILRIHSVHSRILKLHYELYIELMHRPGPITRVQREMIGTLVSSINGCVYWTEHHGLGLSRELQADGVEVLAAEQLASDLKSDYPNAVLAPQDRALLDYSVKLTNAPQAMNALDVDQLRSHGFDDLAIHDICSIVAYFAFVNRIADGLGVELEAGVGQ